MEKDKETELSFWKKAP